MGNILCLVLIHASTAVTQAVAAFAMQKRRDMETKAFLSSSSVNAAGTAMPGPSFPSQQNTGCRRLNWRSCCSAKSSV